jgi:hypothetical protein
MKTHNHRCSCPSPRPRAPARTLVGMPRVSPTVEQRIDPIKKLLLASVPPRLCAKTVDDLPPHTDPANGAQTTPKPSPFPAPLRPRAKTVSDATQHTTPTIALYRFRRLSSSTAKSAARAVNAMYDSDGFWHAVEAMHEPSVTNTFAASHT